MSGGGEGGNTARRVSYWANDKAILIKSTGLHVVSKNARNFLRL